MKYLVGFVMVLCCQLAWSQPCDQHQSTPCAKVSAAASSEPAVMLLPVPANNEAAIENSRQSIAMAAAASTPRVDAVPASIRNAIWIVVMLSILGSAGLILFYVIEYIRNRENKSLE